MPYAMASTVIINALAHSVLMVGSALTRAMIASVTANSILAGAVVGDTLADCSTLPSTFASTVIASAMIASTLVVTTEAAGLRANLAVTAAGSGALFSTVVPGALVVDD